MALKKRGKHWYGDSQTDIRDEVRRYSEATGYPAQYFADARCSCGETKFRLSLDDTEGAAIRRCTSCDTSHPIGDSESYAETASLEECACPCGEEVFEITAGVSLYDASEDVRWMYLGCRCPACGLTAVYGDWKNEFLGYRSLLALV
jgi:hypothetical protein